MKKSKWQVKLPNGKTFTMVGSEKTHAEALEYVRGIWFDAMVE